jgi:CRP-like cAMP-binding protein
MDSTQITRLEEQGVTQALHPGVPPSLIDPEMAWVVLEGRLDLFLVEMYAGEPAGARHHFLRVEAGNPVMGFGTLPDPAFGIIANPAVGSKVLCLQLKRLRQAAAGSPESVLPLIDKWVENLGSAVADKPAPKDFRILAPGAEVLVEGKSTAVLPLAGVVWIRQIEGSSRLLGDDQMPPVEPGSFFPVSRTAWLQCDQHAQVECLDTRDWLQADPQWVGLRHFQEQLFAYLVTQWRRNEHKERARLQMVAEADANGFKDALHQLAEPLRRGEEDPLEADSCSLDPLFHVCRIVGSANGIDIPPVPRALEYIKQRDPVRAIAQAARVRARQVILKSRWWNQESGPMVAFLDPGNRPVALLPGRKGYQLCDPAARVQTPVDEKLASKLHSFAYVFYRSFPAKPMNLSDILSFGLKDCGGDVTTVLLMGIAAGLLGIATPVLTGIIFDTLIPGAERTTLAEFSIFLVIVAVGTALFSLTRSLATLRLQSKMEATVQAAVWDRLLALPVPFFRNFTSGDLAKRSLGISQIREVLTGSVLSSILTGIFSITSGALMFYYSWRLALIATALVFISFVILTFCGWLQVYSGSMEIARLLTGEIVGEISFVDSRPPSASVKAAVDSQVLAVPKAALRAKLHKDLGFASRFYLSMATFLAYRLRLADARLTSGQKGGEAELHEDPDELHVDMLENIALASARFDMIIKRLASHSVRNSI